nr:MAG TPA: hypothetical protein [Caudoviricetes sp.]
MDNTNLASKLTCRHTKSTCAASAFFGYIPCRRHFIRKLRD